MSGGRTIAVMQPYFFPYAGYLSLIKHTDQFILLDTVQFIKSGWINRNRLLRQDGGSLWFNVPLNKHSTTSRISEITIHTKMPWQAKILGQIAPYKKIAPHYEAVKELLTRVIDSGHTGITELNKFALEVTCDYLHIPHRFDILSEMDLFYDAPEAPDEWPLKICQALGDVQSYWNPPGGQSFYDRSKYDAAGIDLKFLQLETPTYDQRRADFIPHLSIIDTLMFNAPEEMNAMLDRYTLY